MKINSLFPVRAVVACALTAFVVSMAFGRPLTFNPGGQTQTKSNLSDAETKAVIGINSARDAAAKLAAAEEFVKKYPKSASRAEVAAFVAGQIALVKDAAEKLALTEKYQKVFSKENELEVIKPVQIGAYLDANRVDDAFNVAAAILAKNPDHVGVLAEMTIAGTEEAKRGNAKYVTQSKQYGIKAIELIEADKKPAHLDFAAWATQKAVLPHLYQEIGILSLMGGNAAEARKRLEKAIELNPTDPFNYALLGSIINEDYQQMAQRYKALTDSKEKEEMMKKINGLLDTVVETYARAVGLAEGRPEYQQLRDQVLQDLTPYYKFRHSQSTEGLQQLIDKYKAPAKP